MRAPWIGLALREILRAKVHIHFRMRDGFSLGEQVADDIYIDLQNRVPPAKTFLHEMLHCIDLTPSKLESEALIKFAEREIWNSLSATEKLALYRKLFETN